MADFARRLGGLLRLTVLAPLTKTRPTPPQKDMNNSWKQARNLDGVFQVVPAARIAGPVLLLDDICDSGWTFTVVSALLRQSGSGHVFPLALAVLR
jgi:ATP-dependent DNA helicase RecQ